MAGKKKKKKRSGRGGGSSSLNLVVGSKVKEAVKQTGYRCSGDLVDALNTRVNEIIHGAVERCHANNRGTVRPQDL